MGRNEKEKKRAKKRQADVNRPYATALLTRVLMKPLCKV